MLKRAVSRTRLSYVQRARLLEKIKTDDEFCKQSMETGRFLLYHKGQPLLRLGQSHFVDFSYCDKICDDVFNTSAALSVAEDGVPMFATSVLKARHKIILETIICPILCHRRLRQPSSVVTSYSHRSWWPPSSRLRLVHPSLISKLASSLSMRAVPRTCARWQQHLWQSNNIKPVASYLWFQGWSLLTWARKTRFCSVCGTKIQRWYKKDKLRS